MMVRLELWHFCCVIVFQSYIKSQLWAYDLLIRESVVLVRAGFGVKSVGVNLKNEAYAE